MDVLFIPLQRRCHVIKILNSCLLHHLNFNYILISPEELQIPEYLKKDVFEKKGITFTEVDKMEDVMPQLDILYMTRVQRERFFNEADYVRLKDSYILDMDKLKIAKKIFRFYIHCLV